MEQKKAFLFGVKLWHTDPLHYLLVYSETEDGAREIGAKQVRYHNNSEVTPKALILLTYGL